MPLPWTFANATTLFTSRLDDDFNALGALTVIPCTATGTNTIALTPSANTPTISAYSNLSPIFAFLAAASSSGAITINVNGIGAKNLYKNNGATAAGSGDIVIGGLYLISYNSALNGAVGGFVLDNPSTTLLSAVTVQRFTSGSGTYTPTAGTVRVRVTIVGAGGGGGAVATNTGVTGVTSSFESWTANGGVGGVAAGGAGGAGGSGGGTGTGTLINRIGGGAGGSGQSIGAVLVDAVGGMGGNNPLGGAGRNGAAGVFTGQAAAANTGGGGGGATGNGSSVSAGGGGGAGEYVEVWMTVAQASGAAYAVGAGGAGGAAGTFAGGPGAAGIIICEEFPF